MSLSSLVERLLSSVIVLRYCRYFTTASNVPNMVESTSPDIGVMVEAAVCVDISHVLVVRFKVVIGGT